GWTDGCRQSKHRVRDDIDHQRDPAAKPVGHQSEQNRSYWTHRQRQENCLRDGGNFRLELSRNRADTEVQKEEVKSVDRPAQKAGNESIPLHWRKPAKMADEFH